MVEITEGWKTVNRLHLNLEEVIDTLYFETHKIVNTPKIPQLVIISRDRIADIVHCHFDDTMATIQKWCSSQNTVQAAESRIREDVDRLRATVDQTILFDYDKWYSDLLDWRVLSYIDELLYANICADNVYWWNRRGDIWIVDDGGDYLAFKQKTEWK